MPRDTKTTSGTARRPTPMASPARAGRRSGSTCENLTGRRGRRPRQAPRHIRRRAQTESRRIHRNRRTPRAIPSANKVSTSNESIRTVHDTAWALCMSQRIFITAIRTRGLDLPMSTRRGASWPEWCRRWHLLAILGHSLHGLRRQGRRRRSLCRGYGMTWLCMCSLST